MDDSLQAQINVYLSHLNVLIQRGIELRGTASSVGGGSHTAAIRAWQEECGSTVNQLSGGSKAHWLARAYSQAFLMRSAGGSAVEEAKTEEIVERLLEVLKQAVATLSQTASDPGASLRSEGPPPRKFEFVHGPELRRVLEQAYRDCGRDLEEGRYYEALRTACGILEAIVTDALEHKGASGLLDSGAPARRIAEWPFETRLKVAEKAGLIRGGCARLPAVARSYRDHEDSEQSANVSERDARQTLQVLRVVMRDLDPGR